MTISVETKKVSRLTLLIAEEVVGTEFKATREATKADIAAIVSEFGRKIGGPTVRKTAPRKPTAKQLEARDFLASYEDANGKSPTIREMSQSFGIKPGAVSARLKSMQTKGLITRTKGKARGVKAVRPQQELMLKTG